MATFTERLQFLVALNADDAVRGFQKIGNEAEKNLKKADDGFAKNSAAMTRWGSQAMAFAGVAGVALFGMARASDEAALSQEKLQQTIDSMPQLAGASIDAFNDLAAAIQAKTAADADQIVSGQSLAGQMGLTQAQILELTPLAVDLARKMGFDLDTAFKTAAKAATGSEGALKKMGVSVNEAAHEVDPFRATVDALGQSVGGFAEREGATFSGSLERMKNSAGDVMEAIGSGVAPVFETLAGVVTTAAQAFTSLPAPVQKAVGGLAAIGTTALGTAGAASFLVGQITKTVENVSELGTKLVGLGPKVLGVAGIVGAAGAVYLTYAAAKEKARQETVAYAEALKKQRDGNEQELLQLTASKFAADRQVEAMQRLGFTLQDITAIVLGEANPAWDDLVEQFERTDSAVLSNGETIRDTNGVLKSFIQSVETQRDRVEGANEMLARSEVEQRRVAAATENTARTIKLAADETNKLGEAVGNAIDPSDDLATSMGGVAEMAHNAAEAIKEQQDSLNELIDAQFAATDAAYGYQDAQWAAEDAVNALKVAEETAAPFSRDLASASMEAEQAVLAQAEAALKLAEDQAAANGETLTAQDRAAILRAELEKLKNKFPEMTPFIDDYIGRLSSIPGRVKTILEIEERFIRRNDSKIISDTYGASAATDGVDRGGPVPAQMQVVMADVVMDGQKVGQAMAKVSVGAVRANGFGGW